MNISMTTALVGGIIMTLRQLDASPELRSNLQCVGCGRKISYVSSHYLRNGTLKRSCLRASWSHSEDCEYTASGRLRRLVKEASGDFIETETEKFLLRMDLSTHKKEKAHITIQSPDKERFITSGTQREKRLTSYITTIKRIIEINNELEESDDGDGSDDSIRRLINVQVNGRSIKWDQFYYKEELDELRKCFRYGKKYKGSIVCIEGEFSFREANGFCSLELAKPLVRDRNAKGIREIPSVSFLMRNVNVKDNLRKAFEGRKKRMVTVLATVQCTKAVVKNNDYCFMDIKGEIVSRKQVLFL